MALPETSVSAAAVPQIHEELGIDLYPTRLFAVDYREPQPGRRGSALRFIFMGPELKPEEIAAIRLPDAELSEYGFFALGEMRDKRPVGCNWPTSICSGIAGSSCTYQLDTG